MITVDQPNSLPDNLLVAFSSRDDGTMLDRSIGVHEPSVVVNRQAFCKVNSISYDDIVYERITYSDTASYDLLVEVDEHSTTRHVAEVAADGVFTSSRGVGLFLPVADCIATVVHDPIRHFLAVLHLGRHSTLTELLPKAIQRFVSGGSSPSSLIVWMGPSAQKQSYKMKYFDHAREPAWQNYVSAKDGGFYLDMQGYNRQRFVDCGLLENNIHVSSIDTVTNHNYFSHADGDAHGRQALVAMMR